MRAFQRLNHQLHDASVESGDQRGDETKSKAFYYLQSSPCIYNVSGGAIPPQLLRSEF